MGSRCVTGRLLLRPDRNVHAPVGGGGRSLTDCMARLVSAPILDPRSWTPSVASVTAPASSIIYLFMPQILAVGARDEVHAMRRKKFFGTGLRFGRVRWGASVSQSVIYFTVPPRAAHPTSLRRRVSSVPQDRISRASHTNFGQHRSIMDTAQSHSHTKKFRSPLLSIDKY